MESRLNKIGIQIESLGHALKDKFLWVPPNQRDYAWKEKHVSDLYSDLKLAIANHASEYFLGSIVVIPGEGGRLMVVDGQQRLATALILLAAIRDFHDNNRDENGARILERGFILSQDYDSREDRPHLRLNDADHEYFLTKVLLPKSNPRRSSKDVSKSSKPSSHARINTAARVAARTVKEIVAGFKPEVQFGLLKKWVNFLENGARVIWVSVPDESSAYTIFETMNDRGLALSATDLIKNYLFGRAGEERLSVVKHNWSQMTGILDAVGESEIAKSFIRHYWVSRYGIVRHQELFDAIKGQYKNSADAVQFSQQLASEAVNYVALLNPSHSLWTKYGDAARKGVATLNLLGVEQIRPLLLTALEKFDIKEMSKLLTLSVSWAVRLIIAGTQGTGALEQLYGGAALQTSEGSLKSAADISRHMSKEVPKDEKFESDFSEAKVSKSALARYYLRALERQQQNEAAPYFIPNDELIINLEHIMPENPSDEWSHVPAEIFESHVNRLGNQVLLKANENTIIGNRGYKFKKPFLKKADLKLTAQAGKYTDWGAKEIEDRQRKLAKLAVLTWSLKVKP